MGVALKWSVVLGVWFFLGSCASTYVIRSSPEGAKVFSEGKELGATPLSVSDSELGADAGGGRLITLKKDGFKELLAWVPADGRSYDIRFNLSALYRREKGDVRDAIEHKISRTDLYRLTDKLLSFQTSLLTGSELSEQEFQALLEANPSLGSMHFLEAIRLLKLKDDKQAAVVRLREAIRLAPAEYDFLGLKNEIEKQ